MLWSAGTSLVAGHETTETLKPTHEVVRASYKMLEESIKHSMAWLESLLVARDCWSKLKFGGRTDFLVGDHEVGCGGMRNDGGVTAMPNTFHRGRCGAGGGIGMLGCVAVVLDVAVGALHHEGCGGTHVVPRWWAGTSLVTGRGTTGTPRLAHEVTRASYGRLEG